MATDTQSDTDEEEREQWKKDENGESETRECPVCKAGEEDWDHYDYECRGVKEMNKKVAESMGRTHAFSRFEWSLEEEGMEKEVMLNIAKARWIYHCERVMNRLNRRRTIVAAI